MGREIWVSVIFAFLNTTPSVGLAESCQYLYSEKSLDILDGRTYENVLSSGFEFSATLRNDWDYFESYRGNEYAATCPNPAEGLEGLDCFASGRVLVEYKSELAEVRGANQEAVILVHGSSTTPLNWWAGETYLNRGGGAVHKAGFDVFAPYVTHESRFLNARRRTAAVNGVTGPELDVLRILLLFDFLKDRLYDRIHLVGISYGGMLSHFAASRRNGDPKLGMMLAIEGWLPNRTILQSDPNVPFLWNWEMVFPTISDNDFLNILSNGYYAYGSCHASLYEKDYASLPSLNVIRYRGGHQFLLSIFKEALERHQNE